MALQLLEINVAVMDVLPLFNVVRWIVACNIYCENCKGGCRQGKYIPGRLKRDYFESSYSMDITKYRVPEGLVKPRMDWGIYAQKRSNGSVTHYNYWMEQYPKYSHSIIRLIVLVCMRCSWRTRTVRWEMYCEQTRRSGFWQRWLHHPVTILNFER